MDNISSFSSTIQQHGNKSCVREFVTYRGGDTINFFRMINIELQTVYQNHRKRRIKEFKENHAGSKSVLGTIYTYFVKAFSMPLTDKRPPDFLGQIEQFQKDYSNSKQNSLIQSKDQASEFAKILLHQCDLLEQMADSLNDLNEAENLKKTIDERYIEINSVLSSLLSDPIFNPEGLNHGMLCCKDPNQRLKIRTIRRLYIKKFDQEKISETTKKLALPSTPTKKRNGSAALETVVAISSEVAALRLKIALEEYDLLRMKKKEIRLNPNPDFHLRKLVNQMIQQLLKEMETVFSQGEINPSDSSLFNLLLKEHKLRFLEGGFKNWSFREDIKNLFQQNEKLINKLQTQREDIQHQIEAREKKSLSLQQTQASLDSYDEFKKESKLEVHLNEIQELKKEKNQIELGMHLITLNQTIEGIKTLAKRIRDNQKSLKHLKENAESLAKERVILTNIRQSLANESSIEWDSLSLSKEIRESLEQKISAKEQQQKNELNKDHKIQVLDELISELTPMIDYCKREASFTEARIEEFSEKYSFLNELFEDIYRNYHRLWNLNPKIDKSLWNKFLRTTKHALCFGFLSQNEFPLPQELIQQHHLAKMGYFPLEVLQEWIEQASNSKDQRAFIVDQLKVFQNWADQHPNTASHLAGDLSLTISTLGENNIFIRFISALRGRTYAYLFIANAIQGTDEPLDKPDEMWCRALCDICLSGPELASFARFLKNSSSSTGILSLASGAVQHAFTTLTNDSINEFLNAFRLFDQVKALHYLRVMLNATISLPYIDSIIEKEKAVTIRNRGIGKRIALSPKQVANEAISDLSQKIMRWQRLVRESKGIERVIRLIPGITVVAIVVPVAMAILRGPISFKSALSLSSIFSSILMGYPKWMELTNQLPSFQRTVQRVNQMEASEAYNASYGENSLPIHSYIDEIVEDLQIHNALVKFPEENEQQIQQQKKFFETHTKHRQIYNQTLNEVYEEFKKILDTEYDKAIKENPEEVFIDLNNLSFLSRKSRIAHIFSFNIPIKEKIYKQIRDRFTPQYLDVDSDLTENLVQSCVTKVGNRLIQRWLKPHLLNSHYAEMIQFFIENGSLPYLGEKNSSKRTTDPRKTYLDECEKLVQKIEEDNNFEPMKPSVFRNLADTLYGVLPNFKYKISPTEK